MKVLVFGGSGKMGAAVAFDLVRDPSVEAVGLVGRRREVLEEPRAWLGSASCSSVPRWPRSYREAPTVSTDVQIAISAMVARVTVAQAFTNPGQQWLEGVYVFPLPEDAAVDHMRMQIGERIIEGEIKEREEAKRTYEEAKAEGRKASLVEQERPNLFTNSVANIGPGEMVKVTIEYQKSLRLEQGQMKLRFPMAVTPRDIPGMPLSADEKVQTSGGSGWSFDTTSGFSMRESPPRQQSPRLLGVFT